jgi:hypothetical protein
MSSSQSTTFERTGNEIPPQPIPASTGLDVAITPLGHAVFLGLIVVPFALVPYLAITSRLRALHSSVDAMSSAMIATRHELKTALWEAGVRKHEHQQAEKMINELRSEIGHTRKKMQAADKGILSVGARHKALAEAMVEERRRIRYVLAYIGH